MCCPEALSPHVCTSRPAHSISQGISSDSTDSTLLPPKNPAQLSVSWLCINNESNTSLESPLPWGLRHQIFISIFILQISRQPQWLYIQVTQSLVKMDHTHLVGCASLETPFTIYIILHNNLEVIVWMQIGFLEILWRYQVRICSVWWDGGNNFTFVRKWKI